ncbi:MAG: signal peptidase I [Clostridium beijerinckii]|uniref:signal peptidase I n=2 Tax=Clostridiaceae TaxID=31979 RepID=UPI000683DE47|nr:MULTISPECIES: signal peptidase I [Clostridium]ALB44104.1 signal peptidase I [Clostridium beijerinckii NRRL B-598]AVK48722.1 S26 family signal peptidase [Clostridium sp. MF28]MCI1477174.1 signal peptidase I [Clostridium beijerinckii]MCI1577453.1 signal peptidase I [Clostridium beijerinckii]MCI1585930.1 signal peptidase I [Clostridium beijerinckii]
MCNMGHGGNIVAENNEDEIVADKKEKKKSILNEWIIDIAVVLCIALLVWNFVGYGVWITSGSMIPTLEVKDRLLVTRVHNPKNLKEGDIVLFKNDEFKGEILIKRLIGLPGDTIEIKNGVVYRNGQELKEDYVKNNEIYNGSFKVPDNKYFFLGDNRANSDDSRYWKDPYVDESYIEGKAQVKYYPIKDFEILK